jgi:hypothetical protein
MDPLEWILRFTDDISAPAKAMSASVGKLVGSLIALEKALDRIKGKGPLSLPGVPGMPGGAGRGRGGAGPQGGGLGPFNQINFRQARQIMRDAGGDLERYNDKLRKMGVSSRDAALLSRPLRREMDAQRKAALGVPGPAGGLRRNIWTASHALNIAQKVGGAGHWALDAAKAPIESFLDSAKFRESTLVALTEMLRETKGAAAPKEALGMFGRAQRFAVETPMETRDVTQGYQSLMGGGVKPEHVESVFASAADVFAKFGKESYESFLHGLVKMQSLGKVNQDTLTEMAAGAKLNVGKVYETLGELAGFKGDKDTVRDKVIKKLGKGEFSSSAGMWASMKAMSGGENFGGFAKAQAFTLTGMISTFKSSLSDLLESVDLGKWKGMEELKTFIGWFTDQIKPGTANANRLLAAIEKVINGLFGGLKGIRESGIERLIAFVESAATGIEAALRKAWEVVPMLLAEGPKGISDSLEGVGVFVGQAIGKGFAEAMPLIIEQAGKALPSILKGTAKGAWAIGTGAGEGAAKLVGQFADAGPALRKKAGGHFKALFSPAPSSPGVSRLLSGMKEDTTLPAAVAQMKDAGAQLVEGAHEGFVDKGEIKSPSRLMARAAEQLVWGARDGMVGAAGRGAGQGAGRAITVNNYFTMGDGPPGDESSLVQAIGREMRHAVLDVLEHAAAQQGILPAQQPWPF